VREGKENTAVVDEVVSVRTCSQIVRDCSEEVDVARGEQRTGRRVPTIALPDCPGPIDAAVPSVVEQWAGSVQFEQA
jgi:hypothetical protein